MNTLSGKSTWRAILFNHENKLMDTLVKGGEEFIQGNDKIQKKKSKDNTKDILYSYIIRLMLLKYMYNNQANL